MKKLVFVLSFVLFTCAAVPERSAVAPSYEGEMIVVAIAGQSNASGRGGMPGVIPTDALMWILGDDFRWYGSPGQEPSDRRGAFRVDPVNYDSNAEYSAGYGIAKNLHLHYPDVPVAIVNCSKGATSITQWQPSRDSATLFGACLKKIHAGMSQGDLAFVFFYQGEREASNAELAPVWDVYFDGWVIGMREHFGPDLPIVYAQIAWTAAPEQYPYWEVVQTRQAAYSATNVRMIITSDLTLRKDDAVHISVPGQDEIGRRVVDAYCSIVDCP